MTRRLPVLPARPLERRERDALALFSVLALAQGWTGAAVTHVLPFVQDEFSLSDTAVFDLMTAIRVVSLAAISFSWWGDRHGRRRPLLLAFTLLPIATLGAAVLPGVVGFTAAQSVARVGTIALGALAVVVLAEEMGPAVRGWAIGVYALVGAMGTGLGLLLRPLGAAPGGWRMLLALSSLPVLALPLVMRRLTEPAVFVPAPTRLPLRTVLTARHRRRLLPLAVLAATVSAFTAPAANLALLRLENDLGWSTGAASLLVAVASGPGVLIGVLAGGRLADSWGRRPTQAMALLVGVGGGFAFYLIDGGWAMVAGVLCSNAGAFAFAPAFAAHRTELFPTAVRATAVAWTVNASIAGGIAGFAVGRFLVAPWGIDGVMVALGGAVLVAALVLVPLPETRGRHLDDPTPVTG